MDLDEALIARWSAVTSLTGEVSTRIHGVERPQGEALPALVYEVISSVPDDLVEGEGNMVTTRLQVAGLSRLRSQAVRIAALASAALLDEAVVGEVGNQMEFEPAQRTLPRDSGGEADAKGFVHRAISDVIIRHSAGTLEE